MSDAPSHADCVLCTEPAGILVWQDTDWRIVRVADEANADFPAFYRVIAQRHVAEFTDLAVPQRQRCMALVGAVEQVLRERLRPTKINLASLGNMVAHLHWHVIARFDWDSHFPDAVWAARRREVVPAAASRLGIGLDVLDAAVVAAVKADEPVPEAAPKQAHPRL